MKKRIYEREREEKSDKRKENKIIREREREMVWIKIWKERKARQRMKREGRSRDNGKKTRKDRLRNQGERRREERDRDI